MPTPTLGKIAVVDSDENIASLLSVNLRSEGYEVVVFNSPANAAEADLSAMRLVVADGMDQLPSGLNLLQKVKSGPLTAHVGFIICTSHDSESLTIDALDSGADDFIIKPFSLRELVARAKAVIRRHSRAASAAPSTGIEFHSLHLDLLTKRVTDAGQLLTLTKTEYAILETLLKQTNNYVTRAEIYKTVWNDDIEKTNDRIVDTNISRLRKKLGDLGGHLINRSGLGYMMKL